MKTLAALLLLSSISCATFASENLTFEALVKGSASGLVEDEMSQKIMEKTHSHSPISMDVKVLTRYKQEGCGRLDYIVRQANVLGRDGKLHPLMMEWQMNICKDGSPPAQPLSVM